MRVLKAFWHQPAQRDAEQPLRTWVRVTKASRWGDPTAVKRVFPIEAPDPISAILFMMEQKHPSRRDLEPAIGSRARVAEVINRRRALTLPMIRGLSRLLDIPAEVLIQPYETKRSPRGGLGAHSGTIAA